MNRPNNPVHKQRMDCHQKTPRHLLEYLEQTAAVCPDAPAYCSEEEQFSWQKVAELSQQIGLRLITALEESGQSSQFGQSASACLPAKKIPAKQPLIALLMEKAPHTVIAMLGSVYAGGCYVVLNTALAEMGGTISGEMETTRAENAKPETIKTGTGKTAGRSKLAELLRFLKPDLLFYDTAWAGQAEQLLSEDIVSSDAGAVLPTAKLSDTGLLGTLPSLCLDISDRSGCKLIGISTSTKIASTEKASIEKAPAEKSAAEKDSLKKAQKGVLSQIRKNTSPSDTLCLTVTSSSSGQPKCVETSHLAVIRYIDALTDILRADKTTVFGNQAPFCFDACMKELFVSMKCGGSAWMIPSELFSRPEDLIGYLNRHQINTICWVSSAYSLVTATDAFASLRPEFLRTAAFGSEVLPPSVLAYWQSALPEISFFNLYGPTEATGMSCYYPVPRYIVASLQQEISQSEASRRETSQPETPQSEMSSQEASRPAEPIPIGKPFPGIEVYLLGENGQPVSDGEPGELYIKSNRLAKGYYCQEELTKQVFFTQAPFTDSTDTSSTAEAVLLSETASSYSFYRTGDLAKRLPSGDLVFLGRKDFQVKRMGYRIDLAELERLAMACPQVKSCCCVQKPDGRIVLYVLQHTDVPLPASLAATGSVHAPYSAAALTSRISALLRQSLPSYALPNRIVLRESFPFLPNGKIDRRRLKEE